MRSAIAAALAQAQALPAEDWLVPDLAAALDYDPARAFAFVRDRIGFDPYPGVLRGAEGTLAARSGNAWDRALLLHALLGEMLIPVRLAHGTLDATATETVLARAFTPATDPLPAPGLELTPMLDVAALGARARHDDARVVAALGAPPAGSDRLPGDAAGAAGAAGDDGATGLAAARAAIADHAWVQALIGPTWVDLDPTLPDAVQGRALTAATATSDTPPADEQQRLDLRLEVDLVDPNGARSTQTVLERSLDAAAAPEQELFLYFEPELGGLGGGIVRALTGVSAWQPVLLVDGEGTAGLPFPTGGPGTDVFGDAVDGSALAAMRLVVTRVAPGLPDRSVTRTLLDRVPADADPAAVLLPADLAPLATDKAGPLVLGRIHHLAISNGGLDARRFAYARAATLDFITSRLADGSQDPDYSFADILWPLVVADRAVVIASERGTVPALQADGVRAFVAEPRLYVFSFGPDVTGADPTAVTTETDLLLDTVGVVARDGTDPGAAPRLRRWYGALQSALETQLALGRAVDLGGSVEDLTSASLTPGPLLGFAGDAAGADELRPAARAELAAGAVVLVPEADPGGPAWWTVAPDGTLRAVLDPGLGGIRAEAGRAAPTTADGTYGQGSGAGSRIANRPPGGGGNWNSGKGQYSPARVNPLPNGCKPGQEYVALLGCVSVPAAQAFRLTVGVGVAIIVSLAVVWIAS
ncbi:MAG: transglutaminase domain-containing protein [Chloroflexota bacterium]